MFLAVFLSSFMIFTIFTVGVTYFKMLKIQNIRMSGAKFDALMYGVTDEQAQKCENNPDITLTGFLGICGWIEKTDRDDTPSVGLGWADENYWSKMMKPAREKLEGEYPVAEDEIMVTREALEKCGYDELGVGDSITVTYTMVFRKAPFGSVAYGMAMERRRCSICPKRFMKSRDGSAPMLHQEDISWTFGRD